MYFKELHSLRHEDRDYEEESTKRFDEMHGLGYRE